MKAESSTQILTVPALTDNYCYLVFDTRTRGCVVIDPSEAGPVLAAIAKHSLVLELVLNTHQHHDHVGGNAELVSTFGVPVWCSKTDLARVPHAARGLTEGETFSAAGNEWHVLEIPGHTSGQIAFHLPREKAVFVGDTLFAMGCGRLFEGTPSQMQSSLKKVFALPNDTRVHFGHEYTERNGAFAKLFEPENAKIDERLARVRKQVTAHGYSMAPTLEEEAEINPFMRTQVEGLRRKLGLESASDLEVFTELRQRRNSF